jgi:predicted ATP-grasp superfamily ATP-dependent carboligase
MRLDGASPPGRVAIGDARRSVILLGSDTPIGLAVLRDLGRHGYSTIGIGRSVTAIGSASRHCHHHVVRRDEEGALVEQLVELADRFQASVLLAISESDLLMINRYRARLEESLRVLTPSADRLELVLDKTRCQTIAQSVGLRVPRTFHPASLTEAGRMAVKMAFPVILKWADPSRVASRLSETGLPIIKAEYAADPAALLERLRPYEPIGEFPLVQEYCPGRGLGQMFLARDGEVFLEFQHERLHEWPPEGGISSLCRSIPLSEHGEVRARAKALLGALRWTGVAMVEYRFDPARGEYVFLEVNGRFWGSLPLAVAAGVPFAAGLVALCADQVPPAQRPVCYSRITCCYFIPETKRLFRILFDRARIQDPSFTESRLSALTSYLAQRLNPAIHYYVLSMTDPGPLLADLANILKRLAGRLLRH